MQKERSIWKNLGLALASVPVVGIALIVLVICFEKLGDVLTELESAVGIWARLIVVFTIAYILSLIYLLYQSSVHRNRERKRILDKRKGRVDTLILYWREQLIKKSKPQPSADIIKAVQEMFLQRLLIWAKSDPELWTKVFPNEKYSEHFFGIVDNFMNYWGDKDSKELMDYFEALTQDWINAVKNKGPFSEYHLWEE